MIDKINQLTEYIGQFVPADAGQLEQFRIRMLGKKGEVSQLMEQFRTVPPEQKRELGQKINALKSLAQEKFEQYRALGTAAVDKDVPDDLTRPGSTDMPGSRHPVSVVMDDICEIFERMGFVVAHGPEIEDDEHVFSALNFAPEHPARDMQDTFFIHKDPDVLLRTHTSSIQVRVMEKNQPPIRVICPGRVFRNEAISYRAHCIFHQVEGLYIDRSVSFADLKQAVLMFVREFFGSDIEIRLRPSYFPFTEPSAEVDISCVLCGGKGCNVCKGSGWLEVMGCGMVDPYVLDHCGIDSGQYTGYAFGMGVERLAMLRYGVGDLRLFFENDVRFLRQFTPIK